MKTVKDWAQWIIKYMQENPVNTLPAATRQIEYIVEKIQKDKELSLNPEPIDPPEAA